MSITRQQLENYLTELLQPLKIKDYCPNGLQVAGSEEISHIVSGVTASQSLIDKAIELKADTLLVHHGYFWKGEDQRVIGMKHKRLKSLLSNDINLFAYHLPLDIHPEFGNNAQLAKRLGINVTDGLDQGNPLSIAMQGRFNEPLSMNDIHERIVSGLQREPLIEKVNDRLVTTVAWCTGGGQGYIEQAAEQGIDLFITGEVSEKTIHVARELDINFIAAGHHATERYGALSLGQHLAERFGIQVSFVDIDNPA